MVVNFMYVCGYYVLINNVLNVECLYCLVVYDGCFFCFSKEMK